MTRNESFEETFISQNNGIRSSRLSPFSNDSRDQKAWEELLVARPKPAPTGLPPFDVVMTGQTNGAHDPVAGAPQKASIFNQYFCSEPDNTSVVTPILQLLSNEQKNNPDQNLQRNRDLDNTTLNQQVFRSQQMNEAIFFLGNQLRGAFPDKFFLEQFLLQSPERRAIQVQVSANIALADPREERRYRAILFADATLKLAENTQPPGAQIVINGQPKMNDEVLNALKIVREFSCPADNLAAPSSGGTKTNRDISQPELTRANAQPVAQDSLKTAAQMVWDRYEPGYPLEYAHLPIILYDEKQSLKERVEKSLCDFLKRSEKNSSSDDRDIAERQTAITNLEKINKCSPTHELSPLIDDLKNIVLDLKVPDSKQGHEASDRIDVMRTDRLLLRLSKTPTETELRQVLDGLTKENEFDNKSAKSWSNWVQVEIIAKNLADPTKIRSSFDELSQQARTNPDARQKLFSLLVAGDKSAETTWHQSVVAQNHTSRLPAATDLSKLSADQQHMLKGMVLHAIDDLFDGKRPIYEPGAETDCSRTQLSHSESVALALCLGRAEQEKRHERCDFIVNHFYGPPGGKSHTANEPDAVTDKMTSATRLAGLAEAINAGADGSGSLALLYAKELVAFKKPTVDEGRELERQFKRFAQAGNLDAMIVMTGIVCGGEDKIPGNIDSLAVAKKQLAKFADVNSDQGKQLLEQMVAVLNTIGDEKAGYETLGTIAAAHLAVEQIPNSVRRCLYDGLKNENDKAHERATAGTFNMSGSWCQEDARVLCKNFTDTDLARLKPRFEKLTESAREMIVNELCSSLKDSQLGAARHVAIIEAMESLTAVHVDEQMIASLTALGGRQANGALAHSYQPAMNEPFAAAIGSEQAKKVQHAAAQALLTICEHTSFDKIRRDNSLISLSLGAAASGCFDEQNETQQQLQQAAFKSLSTRDWSIEKRDEMWPRWCERLTQLRDNNPANISMEAAIPKMVEWLPYKNNSPADAQLVHLAARFKDQGVKMPDPALRQFVQRAFEKYGFDGVTRALDGIALLNAVPLDDLRTFTAFSDALKPGQSLSLDGRIVTKEVFDALPGPEKIEIYGSDKPMDPREGKFIPDLANKYWKAEDVNQLRPELIERIFGSPQPFPEKTLVSLAGRFIYWDVANQLPDFMREQITGHKSLVPEGRVLKDLSSVSIDDKAFRNLTGDQRISISGTIKRFDTAQVLGQLANGTIEDPTVPANALIRREIINDRLDLGPTVIERFKAMKGKVDLSLAEKEGELRAKLEEQQSTTKNLCKHMKDGVSFWGKVASFDAEISPTDAFLNEKVFGGELTRPMNTHSSLERGYVDRLTKLDQGIKTLSREVLEIHTRAQLLGIAKGNLDFVQQRAASGKADDLACKLFAAYGRAVFELAPDVRSALLRQGEGADSNVFLHLKNSGDGCMETLPLNEKLGTPEAKYRPNELYCPEAVQYGFSMLAKIKDGKGLDTKIARQEALAGIDQQACMIHLSKVSQDFSHCFSALSQEMNTVLAGGDQFESARKEMRGNALEIKRLLSSITADELGKINSIKKSIDLAIAGGTITDEVALAELRHRSSSLDQALQIMDPNYPVPDQKEKKVELEAHLKDLEALRQKLQRVPSGEEVLADPKNALSHLGMHMAADAAVPSRFLLDREIADTQTHLDLLKSDGKFRRLQTMLGKLEEPEFQRDSDFKDWIIKDGVIIVCSVVAVAAAMAAIAFSGGTATPLVVAAAIAAASMIGAGVGAEAEVALGLRSEGSLPGDYLRGRCVVGADFSQRPMYLSSDVAKPLACEFALNTLVGWATLHVSDCLGGQLAKLTSEAKGLFVTENGAVLSELSSNVARIEAMSARDATFSVLMKSFSENLKSQLLFVAVTEGAEHAFYDTSKGLGYDLERYNQITSFMINAGAAICHHGLSAHPAKMPSKGGREMHSSGAKKMHVSGEPKQHLVMEYRQAQAKEFESYKIDAQKRGSLFVDNVELTNKGLTVEWKAVSEHDWTLSQIDPEPANRKIARPSKELVVSTEPPLTKEPPTNQEPIASKEPPVDPLLNKAKEPMEPRTRLKDRLNENSERRRLDPHWDGNPDDSEDTARAPQKVPTQTQRQAAPPKANNVTEDASLVDRLLNQTDLTKRQSAVDRFTEVHPPTPFDKWLDQLSADVDWTKRDMRDAALRSSKIERTASKEERNIHYPRSNDPTAHDDPMVRLRELNEMKAREDAVRVLKPATNDATPSQTKYAPDLLKSLHNDLAADNLAKCADIEKASKSCKRLENDLIEIAEKEHESRKKLSDKASDDNQLRAELQSLDELSKSKARELRNESLRCYKLKSQLPTELGRNSKAIDLAAEMAERAEQLSKEFHEQKTELQMREKELFDHQGGDNAQVLRDRIRETQKRIEQLIRDPQLRMLNMAFANETGYFGPNMSDAGAKHNPYILHINGGAQDVAIFVEGPRSVPREQVDEVIKYLSQKSMAPSEIIFTTDNSANLGLFSQEKVGKSRFSKIEVNATTGKWPVSLIFDHEFGHFIDSEYIAKVLPAPDRQLINQTYASDLDRFQPVLKRLLARECQSVSSLTPDEIFKKLNCENYVDESRWAYRSCRDEVIAECFLLYEAKLRVQAAEGRSPTYKELVERFTEPLDPNRAKAMNHFESTFRALEPVFEQLNKDTGKRRATNKSDHIPTLDLAHPPDPLSVARIDENPLDLSKQTTATEPPLNMAAEANLEAILKSREFAEAIKANPESRTPEQKHLLEIIDKTHKAILDDLVANAKSLSADEKEYLVELSKKGAQGHEYACRLLELPPQYRQSLAIEAVLRGENTPEALRVPLRRAEVSSHLQTSELPMPGEVRARLQGMVDTSEHGLNLVEQLLKLPPDVLQRDNIFKFISDNAALDDNALAMALRKNLEQPQSDYTATEAERRFGKVKKLDEILNKEELQRVGEIVKRQMELAEERKRFNEEHNLGDQNQVVLTAEQTNARVQSYLKAEGAAEGSLPANGEVRKEKVFHIVLGHAGAGKTSAITGPLQIEYGARMIDADWIKPHIEGYAGGIGNQLVHNASTEVAAKVRQHCMDQGENIIVSGIGRTQKGVYEMIEEARSRGYKVAIHFADIPPETSAKRVFDRGIKPEPTAHTALQMIPPDYSLGVGNRPRVVFDQIIHTPGLVDAYSLYDTSPPYPQPGKLVIRSEHWIPTSSSSPRVAAPENWKTKSQ